MPPIYDTYASIKRLMASGMSELEATAIVNEQMQLMAEHLSTKDDLKALDLKFYALSNDVAAMRSEMKARMDSLEAKLDSLESRVIARLSILMIALATALAAMIKVF